MQGAPIGVSHGAPVAVGSGPQAAGPKPDQGAPGYNDIPFAILFIIDLVAILVLAVVNFHNISTSSNSNASNSNAQSNDLTKSESTAFFVGITISFIAALVFGFSWLKVLGLPSIAPNIIKFSMYLQLFALSVITVLLLLSSPIAGIFCLVILGLTAFWFYYIRNRIEFASVMLEMSTAVVNAYKNTIGVAFGMQLFSLVWVVVWVIAVVGAAAQGALMIFLVFSYYWMSAVFFNVIHVAVGGVAATWYYQSQSSNVTSASMKRACTTSFGSICFGSLIVAVIETIRFLASSMRRDHEIIACIVDCILGCIQSIAEFISKYAYAYVAIWGQPFCPAAKSTWQLLKTRGFDVLINDDLTGLAFWSSTILGGIVSGVAGALVTLAMGGSSVAWPVAFIGFFVGIILTGIMMSVLASCVTIFMVVWAEDPATLNVKHPQFHQKLVAAVRKVYPQIRV